MKLTFEKLCGLLAPGKYGDGNGLVLHVITTERRYWVFRYMLRGKDRMMGLGSAAVVSLDDARQKAREARRLLAEGIDPIDVRRAAQTIEQAREARRKTVAETAALALKRVVARKAAVQRPTHLYRHFNAAGELLYVGISLDALARLGTHRQHAQWYPTIASVTIETFPTRAQALAAELRAIHSENPRHNEVRRVPDALAPAVQPKPAEPEIVPEAAITLAGAARVLSVSERIIRNFIKKGILQADHIGGVTFVRLASIDAIVAGPGDPPRATPRRDEAQRALPGIGHDEAKP